MRLLIASEAHFLNSPDGSVWTRGPEDYAFWSSYLETFDEVVVLVRLGSIRTAPDGAARADGARVAFHALDDYQGPWQYLRRWRRLRRQARQALTACDALLLRAPGAVAYLAGGENQRLGQPLPYAVEVLGDPWESLAPGCVASSCRAIARRWSRAWLERLCREAPLCCYVTRTQLEPRYPARGEVFTCSDVRLREAASQSQMERRLARLGEAAAGRRPWQLGFLGSLETLSKAPDVLLAAVRACLDRSFPVRLSIAGDGRYRPPLERLAADLDISNAVRFLGALPAGRAVEDFLDGIDLFLLASRTEGLPRALIEAMARGCPAIGSSVGGIPELLAPDDLVVSGRADVLASRIADVLGDPARLSAMARRNHLAAQSFLPEQLEPVRRTFLGQLRDLANRTAPAPALPAGPPQPSPPRGARLLHVATSDRFWPFLDGQPGYLQAHGFEIGIASSPGPQLEPFACRQGVPFWPVAMARRTAPLSDLRALVRLWMLFRSWHAAIVHAHTPKAGLLAMLAARAARVPVRLYTIHGLVWQTRRGWRRRLLQALERLTCRLADRVFAVSPSIRRRAIEAGLAGAEKIIVLANGSANGLDLNRFDPRRINAMRVDALRRCYQIPEGTPVAGLVGRLVPDKGIAELEAAWRELRDRLPDARLLLVGEAEPHDPLPEPLLARLRLDPRVHFAGWRADMPEHYSLMNVCVLPSRREGLPYAAMEAAAMERPVAGFAADGVIDAVEHGSTGLLAPAGNVAALAAAIARLLEDPGLARRLGRAGRARAERLYGREPLWECLHQQYQYALKKHAKRAARARPPWWKRPVDLAGAVFLLPLLAPLMACIAAAVWLDLGFPILYRQPRPGRGERRFKIFKFRTRRSGAESDRERLTGLGRFLRRTSLDELPQLFNILRGEMSFIGPRPLLERYLPYYTAEERRRHLARPGLAGWAQLHGRNRVGWRERLALDVWYVDHVSFQLDIRIALGSLWMILARQGVEEDPSSVMPDLDAERMNA